MKAIETKYKGYRFRSRLEARWAVFFDALGIKWEYEPEGFDLGYGDLYLPDFKLTNKDGKTQWVEVKPKGVTPDIKYTKFEKTVGCSARLVSGDPLDYCDLPFVCPRCGLILDTPAVFGQDVLMEIFCGPCDASTPSTGGEEEGLLARVESYKGAILINHLEQVNYYLKRFVTAAKAARGARFEHGEKGAT